MSRMDREFYAAAAKLLAGGFGLVALVVFIASCEAQRRPGPAGRWIRINAEDFDYDELYVCKLLGFESGEDRFECMSSREWNVRAEVADD